MVIYILLLRSLCVCVFFLTLVSFSTFFYFFSTFSTRNKGLSATSYEGETKGDFPDGGDSNPQGGVEEEDEFTNELETHNRWVKSKEECSFSFFFFCVTFFDKRDILTKFFFSSFPPSWFNST